MTYNPDNIFARILRKEIPSTFIYDDEYAVAFADIAPAAPVHVLVLPKGEYASFDDFVQKADAATVAGFFSAVQRVAVQLGVDQTGYRLIANHGVDASQTVPHFHMHILGGMPLGGLLADDVLAR